jgi:drug/metabolite transporter (DMT)-like permease
MAPSAALGGFLAACVAFLMAPTLALPLADVPYVLVLGCVVIPIAFTCFVTAPRYIPVPEFSLVVLLEMVFGPYWVWLALGERPADSAIVGGGIVLLTLFIHSMILLRKTEDMDATVSPIDGA